MRRFFVLFAILALITGLIVGCEKEDSTGIGDGDVGVPEGLSLSQTIPPLLANGVDQVEIVATVVDGQARVMEGVGVYFTTTEGSIEPFGTTDVDGVATTVLTSAASTVDLSAVVTATASQDTSGLADTTRAPVPGGALVVLSNGPLSDELLVEAFQQRIEKIPDGVLAGAAQGYVDDEVTVGMVGLTMTIYATPDVIPADGRSASEVKANVVETTSRVPVESQTIRFGASEGAITGRVSTDATGTAIALLTGSSSGATSNITAYYGNVLTAATSVSFSALSLGLTSGPPVLQSDGTWHVPVTAVLLNAENNPVDEVTVAFTTSAGSILSPVETNVEGLAITTLYLGSLPPSVTITARFDELSQDLVLNLDPDFNFTVTADAAALIADGTSATQVTARVTTPENNPVSGIAVAFTTDLGVVTSPHLTGDNGEAVATLTTGTATGTATVTAGFGPFVGQAQVAFTTVPPAAEILLAVDPTSLPADGASKATITATCLDGSGNLVADGTLVAFSVESGGGSVLLPNRTTVDGQASTLYFAGEEAGFVTLKAISGTTESEIQLTLTRLGVGGLVLEAEDASVLADGLTSTVLTATVTDAFGNPVAEGTPVTFNTTLGQLVEPRPTDENGLATVRLRANRYVTGTARVTAKASEFQESVDVKFVSEDPAQIIVVGVDNPSIGIQGSGARESAVVTLVVQDRNSIPVDADHAADLVYEIVPVTGNPDAVVSPTTARTNENGQAVANVLAGTIAGVVELKATAGSVVSQPIRVAIHGDLPDLEHFSIAFEKLNIAGLVFDGIRDPVTAHVGDHYGNPVPDSTSVWYTCDFGLIQGSAFTDDHAEATVDHITAAPRPQIPGGDGLVKITAQTVSKAGDAIFTDGYVMWSGPTIIDITAPSSGFNVPNGGAITISFDVRDANFNPLTGGTTINVTSSAGTVEGISDFVIPDTQSDGFTHFQVTLSDDDPEEDLTESVTVTIDVQSQNGNRVALISGTKH